MPTPIRDLTDQTFGRLVVLGMDRTTPEGKMQWVCECTHADGSSVIKVIVSDKLTRGKTRSCGCIQIESSINRNKVRGPQRGAMYKGVSRDRKYYQAALKERHLGNFQTAEEAARAYDAAAYAEYRADCYLNFPEDYGLPAREAA